jgi:ribosomal protein L14
MLLKESWGYVADNTNIRWVKIFHLYKGFNRRFTIPGLFVKGSARVVEPPRLEYKGFKYKYSVKGDIARLWVIRSKHQLLYKDGSNIRFNQNALIVIVKKKNIKSKFVNGPLSLRIGIKKLRTTFKSII